MVLVGEGVVGVVLLEVHVYADIESRATLGLGIEQGLE